jgi:predicted transcriptional regulator
LRARAQSKVDASCASLRAVHAAIKAKPGSSVEQLGKSLGMQTKQLALPIRKLLAAKQVKTKGQRRGTRYFVG